MNTKAKENSTAADSGTTMPEAQVSTDKRHDDRAGLRERKENAASSPRLPHERDESFDSQNDKPHEVIERAHDDIVEGQVDTDRRGMAGVEEVRRDDANATQKEIPDSSRNPPSTPRR